MSTEEKSIQIHLVFVIVGGKRNEDALIWYKLDVWIQQLGLGSSDEIQYCMFSLPNHKFTQIAEANKLCSYGKVSLYIALFWEVSALGKQEQDDHFVRQFLLLLISLILDCNGVKLKILGSIKQLNLQITNW